MLRVFTLVTLATSCVSAADMFPFTLPWDDASPTVISLAHLNEKPAGKAGFVKIKDGHLFAGDKRFRIFGVNVCFGANFPTHEAAEKVAARMAKFGINCVRFHHMDMFSAPGGIFAKGGKTLDTERLDRLDYFIAKLKEHGIYSDLNLHVSRTHPDRPKSEKKANPDYDKGVDNFSAPMIAFQKDYARDLLTHVNPYTGNRYADEPAVALIEINNENALGFQWWAGEMDNLPTPYAAELDALWGKWIAAKYSDDTRARKFWGEAAQAAGEELLKPETKWYHEKHEGAEARITESEGKIQINVEKPGTEAWHVQFNRADFRIEKDQGYQVRFRVRAPKEMSLNVAIQQTQSPWKVFGTGRVQVGPEMREVTAFVRVNEADDKPRLSISGMGQTPGEFAFESFSMRTAEIDGTLTRLADGSVPSLKKHTFARNTPAKQRDWQQFIWDTETKYWNGMRDFLKSDLGVQSLIVGTQGFWSPAHVQAGMDVIDSHAYWHHPDFHGRGWNQDVWSVKNESMAGAKDGGELSRLAAQRVAGKPFICTEYNHPAPNTYSAETFPLILAFASAQDWDGVFAFAYSHRGDKWDQPHFDSFFDIDRHSVKMATLPGAVASFRRGDVMAINSNSTLRLSPSDAGESAIRNGPGFVRQHSEFKPIDVFKTRFGAAPKLVASSDMLVTGIGPAPLQMSWDHDLQIASVNSRRAKLLVGRVRSGEKYNLEDVTIIPGETRQGWACYQATVLEGDAFGSARRILITATGDTENADQTWTDDKKVSVGRKWGKAPVLVEGPAAEIEITTLGPTPSDPIPRNRAWSLDETGKRRDEIPLEGNRLQIGPQHRTLWYEIVRE
jgi:hypothetical protein